MTTRTKTLTDATDLPVSLLEDPRLAAWSLLGAAIGLVLGVILLRALSVGG